MKNLFPFLILLLVTPVFSQNSITKGVTVNGIALGASYFEVVRKFGKPASEKKRKADECVGGTEMTLRYPGIKFLLWDDPGDPKKFSVGWFEVTSAKWSVSGARVGDTTAAVKKRFGTRSQEEPAKRNQPLIWYYELNPEVSPGSTSFSFRGGKVVSISSMWLMC